MNKILFFLAALIGISGLAISTAHASHLYGADLKYTYLSSNGDKHTYRLTFVVYGDCSSGTFYALNPPSQNYAAIRIFKDNARVQDVILVRVDSLSNIEITPVCPDEANNTACSSPPGNLPGIKKFTYSLDVVLEGTGRYSFIFYNTLGSSTAGRSDRIQNLNPQGFTGIIATLNNTKGQNSSPDFTASPTPFFCVNKDYTYTLGAVDPENDQLVFELAPAIDATNGAPNTPNMPNVAYVVPYSGSSPFPHAAGSLNFSTVTGQLSFVPSNPLAGQTFLSIVVNKVYEIRGTDTVGSSMREMTFVFLSDCSNNPPIDTTSNIENGNVIVENGESFIQTCEGQMNDVSISMNGKDLDGDNVTITWNNLPAGATGTTVNNGTPDPTFHFTWNISKDVPPGDYTFFVTFTDDGCPLSVSKTVSKTIRILPFQGGLLAGTQSPCEGDSNGYAWLYQAPSDLDDYKIIWTDRYGDTLRQAYGHQGDTLFNLPAGVYYLTAVNSSGCTKFFNLGVLPPHYQANIYAADTMGCVGDRFTFINRSVGDLGQFVWDFGDGSPTSSLANPSHIYAQAGIYKVSLKGTSVLGCPDSASVWVYIDEPYVPSYKTDKQDICAGEEIVFTPDAGPNTIALNWNFGAGWVKPDSAVALTYKFEQSGRVPVLFTVQYRNCPQATFSDTIRVHPYPVVQLGTDSVLCLTGQSLNLYNLAENPSGTYLYKWNTGAATPDLEVKAPGRYALTQTSAAGCATTESIVVHKDCYVDIPNSFTPNGDGVNDYFFPRQLVAEGLSGFTMRIFNRWGVKVFETDNPAGRGWDGRFNNKEQAEGVYIYNIQVLFKNQQTETYTGNLTLLR